MVTKPLLDIRNLTTEFQTEEGIVRAVEDVSFYVNAGEVLGVVGESGCGKSVTALSIMQLVATPPGRFASGEIYFHGENLMDKPESQMRKIRGKDMAMIFQEPMSSLNPVYSVGYQIAEAIRLHQGVSKKQAWQRAIEMLERVGIPDASQRASEYPHQMSGGMCQRVMIAMALSCDPPLLIADEPTTALDVTIQAQILQLMKGLRQRIGTTIVLITHDLGVIAEMADRVLVMYAGRVVEEATVTSLFRQPRHPYTRGLLKSIPRLDQPPEHKLHIIEGTVPHLSAMPPGCRFHPRCEFATEICKNEEPSLEFTDDGRSVACWHWDKIEDTTEVKSNA